MNRLKHLVCGASLALVLTVAAATGFVPLAIGFLELCDGLIRTERPPTPSYSERLVVSEEGIPYIVHWQRQPFHKLETLDLDHQPITRPRGEVRTPADLDSEPVPGDHWLRPNTPMNRVKRVATDGRAGENWYMVFAGNRSLRFYFEGLTIDGGETVGYLGRDGFQETQPEDVNQFRKPPRRLQSDLDQFLSAGDDRRLYVMDDRQLLSIDFENRTVDRVIEEEIISMDRLDSKISERGYATNSTETGVWAARTSQQVVAWTPEEGVRRTYVIPQELRNRPFNFFASNEGAIYVTRQNGHELTWAAESGDVTDQKSVSLSSSSHPRQRSDGLSDEAEARIMVAAVPATLWSAGAAFGVLPFVSAQMDEVPYSEALAQWAGELWWVVLPVMAFCAWLSWLTFQLQRRHGDHDAWFWAGFVFLFGLPGYIGYRLHRSWPHNEPLPAPAPTGLEVFAR